MELVTLDSNYQPASLVERYNSLVWTERYFSSGDFQLVSNDVERMIKLLPLESMVSLRESTVPMKVEIHAIEKSINNPPVLTVTGRSFDSVLERRSAVKVDTPGGPRVQWIETADKPSDAAWQVIKSIIIDGTFSSNDILSMVDLIQPADLVIGGINDYEIKPGDLHTVVRELLAINHHGLKAFRPVQGDTKIGLEIYNGADLTDIVAISGKFDSFENSKYLLSYAGSANLAYVFSASASETVLKNQASPEPTGLDRRVMYVDLTNESGSDNGEARNTRGLIELYKSNATALFDGQLGQQVAARYNVDYFLGDIIKLYGEYGLSEMVRIAEFIRSDDGTGYKAYPTLEVVVDE